MALDPLFWGPSPIHAIQSRGSLTRHDPENDPHTPTKGPLLVHGMSTHISVTRHHPKSDTFPTLTPGPHIPLKKSSLIGPVTSKPDVDRFDCEQNSAIIILFIQSEVGGVEFLFCRAAVLSSSQGNTFWRGRYGSCSHESTSTPERIKE